MFNTNIISIVVHNLLTKFSLLNLISDDFNLGRRNLKKKNKTYIFNCFN